MSFAAASFDRRPAERTEIEFFSKDKRAPIYAHLQVLEEDGVSCPVDLREEVLVEDFAHQLEEIHLALVVGLALQQRKQRRLPLPVVDSLHELADHR
jgi:hypothetical protein